MTINLIENISLSYLLFSLNPERKVFIVRIHVKFHIHLIDELLKNLHTKHNGFVLSKSLNNGRYM